MVAAKDAGLKVIRTWAFHDNNRTYTPGGLPKYGTGGEETVMQFFNSDGTVDINLRGLDVVIEAAEATGIKLILALTNNWADYGGMDVYTVNVGGKYHDDVSEDVCFGSLVSNREQRSSTAYPPLRRHTRTSFRLLSTGTKTHPLSLLGSLPTSLAAALMAAVTSHVVLTVALNY